MVTQLPLGDLVVPDAQVWLVGLIGQLWPAGTSVPFQHCLVPELVDGGGAVAVGVVVGGGGTVLVSTGTVDSWFNSVYAKTLPVPTTSATAAANITTGRKYHGSGLIATSP
jgi:hypothetical protein